MKLKTNKNIQQMLIIAFLALIAGGAGVFTMPVLDRDEARYAQATTQMLETNDYVNIRFQDQARNKKPVGIYWAQALSVKVFSDVQARQIWAYRIPSLLAAILAALATYLAGQYLVGRKAAFAGAVLLAVSVLLATEAGIAKTDAALLATTTTMLAVLAALRHGKFRGSALLFWLAMGLSILIKGPLGPALIVLSLVSLVVWERKAIWLRPILVWWGPLLAIAIVLPWLLAIQQATDGGFLRDALGGDFAAKVAGGKEGHGEPPGYYTLLLVFMIFPASFFLIPGAIKSWKNRKLQRTGSDTKFLIAWAVPFFLLLELVPTKLVHYPLLVYPAIALICGLGLRHLAEFRWAKYISVGLAMLMPVLVIVVILYLQSNAEFGVWRASVFVWVLGLNMVGVALVAGFYTIKNKANMALALAVMAGLLWHFNLRTIVAPDIPLAATTARINTILIENDLHPRVLEQVSGPIMSVNYTEPSLVFALGTNTVLAGDKSAVAKAIQSQPSTIIYSLENCRQVSLGQDEDDELKGFIRAMEKQRNLCPFPVAPPFRSYNYSRGACLSVHVFTMRQCK